MGYQERKESERNEGECCVTISQSQALPPVGGRETLGAKEAYKAQQAQGSC